MVLKRVGCVRRTRECLCGQHTAAGAAHGLWHTREAAKMKYAFEGAFSLGHDEIAGKAWAAVRTDGPQKVEFAVRVRGDRRRFIVGRHRHIVACEAGGAGNAESALVSSSPAQDGRTAG